MGNSSACSDEARISFVFFDVTTPSSLFRWETVQTAAMWNGSVLFCGTVLSCGCGTDQFSKVSQKLDGCQDTVWETVQPVGMRHGSALFFSM